MLGIPVTYEKSNVAYAYGITRLKRRDWLKDRLRTEVADHLELPQEFVSLRDHAADVTEPKSNPWKVGFWLAGTTLVFGMLVMALLRP